LTRNVRDFEELAPMIAGLGRRVIVASQRGRGGADPDPSPERYNPGVYAGDMLALLTHLGVERAVFVGTSMGGLMTMITASLAPQRIAAAVLNDVGPEFDPAGIARIQQYAGKVTSAASWEEAARQCREIHSVAFPDEKDDAFWLKFARRTYREQPEGGVVLNYDPNIARTVQPGSEALMNLWPLFEALKPIPTLVIRGEISDILPATAIEEMRRHKPDLEVAIAPRLGHAPFMTEPAVWPALADFLRRTR
jgi:pimeloyl-ACP methyl ester carboxylesterase